MYFQQVSMCNIYIILDRCVRSWWKNEGVVVKAILFYITIEIITIFKHINFERSSNLIITIYFDYMRLYEHANRRTIRHWSLLPIAYHNNLTNNVSIFVTAWEQRQTTEKREKKPRIPYHKIDVTKHTHTHAILCLSPNTISLDNIIDSVYTRFDSWS